MTPRRSRSRTFAQVGVIVFSNASYYRMAEDVPLVIPEVNGDHLGLLTHQRLARGWSGGIVCNTNCTVAGQAISLRAAARSLRRQARVLRVDAGASGAGYPGVPSLDIIDNVIPFIKGEEEKLEAEARKLLGKVHGSGIQPCVLCIERALQPRAGHRWPYGHHVCGDRTGRPHPTKWRAPCAIIEGKLCRTAYSTRLAH